MIEVNKTGAIIHSYGLALSNGTNIGFGLTTIQTGLYAPYDAKIIKDFTGLTRPFRFMFM
ncbi:MAG TPA: hypothetical protein VMT57_08005 [Candidatus Thermoplasmatota archaeon]|nr:hypothetical protein [Candidatus Thermoplasmatota archaeon]